MSRSFKKNPSEHGTKKVPDSKMYLRSKRRESKTKRQIDKRKDHVFTD